MEKAASTTRMRAMRARRRDARGAVADAGPVGVEATARTYWPAPPRCRSEDSAHRPRISFAHGMLCPCRSTTTAAGTATSASRSSRATPTSPSPARPAARPRPSASCRSSPASAGRRERRRRPICRACRTSAPAAAAPVAAATTSGPVRKYCTAFATPRRPWLCPRPVMWLGHISLTASWPRTTIRARLPHRTHGRIHQTARDRVIDVERARAETPGVANVAHLNNAGAALAPAAVHEAVVQHLELETAIGGYEAAARRADRIEHTYSAIATLLGCDADEIGVVENATRAWDMAFYAMRFGPGDRILTSQAEYASNYIALRQVADRTGATVEWIPEDPAGGVDVAALEAMLDERVKVVSLVHVPSHGGLVEPAAAVGALTRAAGIPLLLDACQSVGQMPVDVGEIGCDV